jgi:hypothetical protein
MRARLPSNIDGVRSAVSQKKATRAWRLVRLRAGALGSCGRFRQSRKNPGTVREELDRKLGVEEAAPVLCGAYDLGDPIGDQSRTSDTMKSRRGGASFGVAEDMTVWRSSVSKTPRPSALTKTRPPTDERF